MNPNRRRGADYTHHIGLVTPKQIPCLRPQLIIYILTVEKRLFIHRPNGSEVSTFVVPTHFFAVFPRIRPSIRPIFDQTIAHTGLRIFHPLISIVTAIVCRWHSRFVRENGIPRRIGRCLHFTDKRPFICAIIIKPASLIHVT